MYLSEVSNNVSDKVESEIRSSEIRFLDFLLRFSYQEIHDSVHFTSQLLKEKCIWRTVYCFLKIKIKNVVEKNKPTHIYV